MSDTARCYAKSLSPSSRERQEIDDFSEEDPSLLERLTNEIKKHIASLLSPKDAIALSRTCRTVHADLSLTSLELSVVCPPLHYDFADDTPKRGPKLPIQFSSTHSVTLACTYCDQGWGNRKGIIYIVGHHQSGVIDHEDEEHTDNPDVISQRRLVAQSPLAEHHDEPLRFSFFPREDEVYHIWYTVGGGGGHELHVFDVKQIVTVFDDASRGTRDAFRYLSPLFKPSTSDVIGENGNRAARTDGPMIITEELFLPLLTATLQSLTMIKDARTGDFSSSMEMVAMTNNPIVSHLQEHGLDVTNGEVLHALQNMIPRARVVASILQENFANNSNQSSQELWGDDEQIQNVRFHQVDADFFLPVAVPVPVPVLPIDVDPDLTNRRSPQFRRRLSRLFRRFRPRLSRLFRRY